MAKSILVNVPRLDVPGGVTNYFQVLREHMRPGKQFFEVGATSGESRGMALLRRTLCDYWMFHRRLAKGRFSLVHLNPSLVPKSVLRDAVFLLIARIHAVPVLLFIHGWDEDCRQFIERRVGAVFRRAMNSASGVVVLADDFSKDLKRMGVRTPIFQLTTCVENKVFASTASTERKSKPWVDILYLSRLASGKGVVQAVLAFDLLRQSEIPVRLTIAGDGPERTAAERLILHREIPNVRLLGHVEGEMKARAFLDADIYFFPTFYGEGMPTTVLEAMAYGLPVVTRSVGGLKDFFEDGRMGFITESHAEGDFAKMLACLVRSTDLRREIGIYNREYAQARFTTFAVAEKLENIYAQITG